MRWERRAGEAGKGEKARRRGGRGDTGAAEEATQARRKRAHRRGTQSRRCGTQYIAGEANNGARPPIDVPRRGTHLLKSTSSAATKPLRLSSDMVCVWSQSWRQEERGRHNRKA